MLYIQQTIKKKIRFQEKNNVYEIFNMELY